MSGNWPQQQHARTKKACSCLSISSPAGRQPGDKQLWGRAALISVETSGRQDGQLAELKERQSLKKVTEWYLTLSFRGGQ